ncbi:MAG: deoxyhypusine synthase [Candidatus Parvarchaeum acidophilus ARMAN-5]|uniref:Deoxyhypusine synthase n=1 Tax=Candidatus Parvarchaeum acidophilus ARMAN-5 TaxID=662762 RepID=D6GV87_PARA5|nr:MAG: deoxyhypusine synthase [Candidatus Parvarchaeum acidophilus ARMAN-5]
MLGKKVKNIEIKKGQKVSDLVKAFSEGGGFTAKKLAVASDIFQEMEKDKNCVKFLSFPADIISTGLRGVIVDMVKKKQVDVIITTCGTLDHDLAKVWKDYYAGTEMSDDAKLRQEGINRLYNIFIPNSSYGFILEDKLIPILKEAALEQKEYSTSELISFIGKKISKEKGAKDSIVYWAWKNNIPMIVPGITDGSVGSQIWMYSQKDKDFKINLIKDEDLLAGIVYKAKKSGALMLGGGISKHHTIWWNQFKDGLDYAIYMTTAVEWDGSLSGARLEEAISWGKVKPAAKQITVEGDVTILLPLLYASFLG